jgi:putative oxidoreductase
MSMANEPKPLIPALGTFYATAADLSWVIVRVTAGLMLIPHGWPKVMAGPAAVAANTLAKRGIEPALPFAYLLMFLETIGGIMIAIGLFTRPIAALLVIQFLVIIKVHAADGWSPRAGGAEYVVFWALILLAILLRGGGPYSVDRKLGREV